ncbi:HK97 family phage prohead protease [Jeotgalibaca sp. MA1X17-3]|uniref:HK97 family phage prohead protease n=1 Tax=Jeotgalibaca sp. MA1X17-3 TaxID=2908211 RepID=UPI001F40F3F9|nr:HK97 family phage prohead protease [Jeotgalibaca sp. MA1X17-3]UJF14986.1 HK97 family phage prohead protease [Jeotgalibaca sp. MA1X17-3]
MIKLIVENKKEYRNVSSIQTTLEPNKDFLVEGYATTFEPYELYEIDGVKFYEKIERNSFNGADMSDIIMQYDHTGRVVARKSNDTLSVVPNDYGLLIKADLSKSSAGRELHEDIKSGLVTKMSWAFTVAEEEYDKEKRTRIIKRIKKVYDVSAVSIPANDQTSINAKSSRKEDKNKSITERKRQRLKLKMMLMEMDDI